MIVGAIVDVPNQLPFTGSYADLPVGKADMRSIGLPRSFGIYS